MLTKTTEAGLQALVYLTRQREPAPCSPRMLAGELGLSATYLAKVSAQLVKADILRAQRGSKGGVVLSRPARDITLLDVVQALQGRIVGRYCDETAARVRICGFHAAMQEIHAATVGILGRWTLADLAARPAGLQAGKPAPRCLMRRLPLPGR